MPSPVHPYSEYGVALRTLRSARSWLGLGLSLCVLAQVLGFLLMWYTTQPYTGLRAQYDPSQKTGYTLLVQQLKSLGVIPSGPTTAAASQHAEPFMPASDEAKKLNIRQQWDNTYTMTVPLSQMVGLMAVCSQVIVMFLTLLLILVAQAPGVVHVTRGLIWSILLLFMVLPWQYFARNFPFPGVLYGYQELLGMIGPHVVSNPDVKVYGYQKLLVYGRFILWPAVSLVVLLIVAERFRAGIMLAIGHPLQSMLQPKGGPGVPGKPGAPLPTGPMGRKIG